MAKEDRQSKGSAKPTAAATKTGDAASRGDDKKGTSSGFGPYLFAIFAILVAAVAYYFHSVAPLKGQRAAHQAPAATTTGPIASKRQDPKPQPTKITPKHTLLDDWSRDIEFETESAGVSCDFPVVSAKDADLRRVASFAEYTEYPLVLRGVVSRWPATEKWKRATFVENFGERMVQTGTESSIVYGGGAAGVSMTLEQYVTQTMRGASPVSTSAPSASNDSSDSHPVSSQESFIFDVSILKSMPELTADFKVPKIFQAWDTTDNEQKGLSWHMLSLGPSRAGLPFHLHGETWLGLVHGRKRWFVYPPGYSQPVDVQQSFNHLTTAYNWYESVYPQLSDLEAPPVESVVTSTSSTTSTTTASPEGYRPLECVQEAGDLLYLPRGWSHMTLNIGETIAIGGQAILPAEDRFILSQKVLQHDPLNYEALKASALGLAHIALDEDHRMKSNLIATKNGMVELRKESVNDLVDLSEDTWIILYFDMQSLKCKEAVVAKEADRLVGIWNDLAGRLKGLASVGIVDVTKNPEFWESKYNAVLTKVDLPPVPAPTDGTQGPSEDLLAFTPIVRLYPGGGRSTDILSDAVQYDGKIEVGALLEFATNAIVAQSLPEGSVIAVCAKARRLLKDAEAHIR
jgi:Cupin-like domain